MDMDSPSILWQIVVVVVVGKGGRRVLACRSRSLKRTPYGHPAHPYISQTTLMIIPALTSQDEASASHLPQPMQGYTDGSIMQPNDLPNHPHLGSWTFNQLLELDTPPNSQTPRDIGYPVQPNELVSHHQHFENEMLRNNKDEQVARLVTKIEMLRKEIASIKHNNLPNH
ncbi:hypothetical protein V6N11_048900 [Hibiscus sabdariffa]|uniref:Uncharacterized protein n=1 Tax=Hibiscus sabdariffa TaxID=183260 RepID=A0ABR2PWN0_9ROSI